jgi:hypothetical protein
MTLELSDLDTIKNNALKKFEERVGGAGNKRDEIERESLRLESQLEQLYSFTAMMARRQPDVAGTAKLWDNLVKTCDLFAGKIYQLSQQYSLETAAYDNILDIRGAAEELRALHRP